MTEMDWTRPPSDYVVVDQDGDKHPVRHEKWPSSFIHQSGERTKLIYFGHFGVGMWRHFEVDGSSLNHQCRLVLRSEVEKPDPTIDERRLAWARMAHRRMDETLGNEAAIYSLAASLAEWRG